MTSFDQSDVVRIAKLQMEERPVDGPSPAPPHPRIGELGTVVAQVGDDLYLIEHATDDGRQIWVAEFHSNELALVERRREHSD
jgi:hypothetical protein